MNYRVEEDFEYKGFRCVVVASGMGHRCGYVQIPKGHPYFEKPYEEIDEVVNVHGGLTYGTMSKSYPVETEISSYWLGFDCAHYGDARDLELIKEFNSQVYEIYAGMYNEGHLWTADEVCDELKQMVDQLVEVAKE